MLRSLLFAGVVPALATVATAATTTLYDGSLGTAPQLSANGSPILTGSLHDYSASKNMLPYTSSNIIFLGDDTTEAAGAFLFSSLTVIAPEPATIGVLSMILPLGWRNRRNRLARPQASTKM